MGAINKFKMRKWHQGSTAAAESAVNFYSIVNNSASDICEHLINIPICDSSVTR